MVNVMKRIVLSFLVFFCSVFSYAQVDSVANVKSSTDRKKVAVVLSGGGAKGVAHVAVLKEIEKAGIPVDIVVGTSMGALVGGLYSIGYTTDQLDSLICSLDWMYYIKDDVSRYDQSYDKKRRSEKFLLSLPFGKKGKDILSGGIFQGQNVTNLIAELTFGYHDSLDFNNFKRKYACVAFNVVNGDEVVFHSGVLYKAMRSSMAVPGVFSPIRMDGMVLVDGGMRNNFPVDVAKQMGADFVIGVDVGDELLKEEEIKNVASIVDQIVSLACKAKHEDNVAKTDVYIKVNVDGYSSASFSKEGVDSLVARGAVAAKEHWEDLLALRKKLGLDESYEMPTPMEFQMLTDKDTLLLKNVRFLGIDKVDERRLMHKYKLKSNELSSITLGRIKDIVSYLNGTLDYRSVNYDMKYSQDGYELDFVLQEKKNNSFNLGLRYDTEEKVAVLANLTYQLDLPVPSQFSVTGRLGNRSLIRADYSVKSWNFAGVNFAYMFQHNDVNVYRQAERLYNETYRYHLGEISLYDVVFQQMKMQAGIRYEYFNFNDFLVNPNEESERTTVESQGYVSYFFGMDLNLFNKRSFPSKGMSLSGNISLLTDNMLTYGGNAPLVDFSFSCKRVIPVSSRFAVIPSLSSRYLFSDEDTPYPYQNVVGGYSQGRYTPTQIPFVGLGYMEFVEDAVGVLRLDLRQRVMKNHYFTLAGNAAFTGEEWPDLFDKDPLKGVSLGYGYDSLFGPLEASLYYSDWSSQLDFYISLGFNF